MGARGKAGRAKKGGRRTGRPSAGKAARGTPGARSRATKKTAPRREPAARGAAAELPYYHVDVFTSRLYHGNPAGVVPLDAWLPSGVMQAIAAENNLAETAFFVKDKGSTPRYHLRWFTPTIEVDLCGHATIASAHVLWEHLGAKGTRIAVRSTSGELSVTRRGDLYELDFPARAGEPVRVTEKMCAAMGREPVEAYLARDLMLVFDNRREVYELNPDPALVRALDCFGVIATAPGSGHDFVSRFFVPRAGIDEDPATGSSHCTLVPYWAGRLKKKSVTGHQVSKRGGEMFCELRGKRVGVAGRAVTYLRGTIAIPT